MSSNDHLRDSIRALEERLLQTDVRASRQHLEALLDDDFVEHGSSGRVYDKPSVIAALPARPAMSGYTIEDFVVTALGESFALATYRLVDGRTGEEMASLRSSVWRSSMGTWRLLFHQGTRCAGRPEER